MEKFKFKIKELRLSRNISQQQLANDLNVSKQAVSKWEKGRSLPDIASVEMIAAYFGVSTDYLLNDGIEIATESSDNIADNGAEGITNQSDNVSSENSSRKGFCSALTKKEKWILLSALSFLLVVIIVLSICLGVSESKRRKDSFTPRSVSLYGIEVTYMTHEVDDSHIRVDLYIQNTSEKTITFRTDATFSIDRRTCIKLNSETDIIWLTAGTGHKYTFTIVAYENRYAKGSVTLYYIGHPVVKCRFKRLI